MKPPVDVPWFGALFGTTKGCTRCSATAIVVVVFNQSSYYLAAQHHVIVVDPRYKRVTRESMINQCTLVLSSSVIPLCVCDNGILGGPIHVRFRQDQSKLEDPGYGPPRRSWRRGMMRYDGMNVISDVYIYIYICVLCVCYIFSAGCLWRVSFWSRATNSTVD